MERRKFLATAGIALSSSFVGCLGSSDDEDENGSNSDETNDDGSRGDLDLRLYNYRDEKVSFTVDADADGERVVSGTFELEAPDTIFTDKVVATFPKGTETVTVEAMVDFDDQQKEEKKSFDLPKEDPIEGFEVKLNSYGTLSIDAMPYESPA